MRPADRAFVLCSALLSVLLHLIVVTKASQPLGSSFGDNPRMRLAAAYCRVGVEYERRDEGQQGLPAFVRTADLHGRGRRSCGSACSQMRIGHFRLPILVKGPNFRQTFVSPISLVPPFEHRVSYMLKTPSNRCFVAGQGHVAGRDKDLAIHAGDYVRVREDARSQMHGHGWQDSTMNNTVGRVGKVEGVLGGSDSMCIVSFEETPGLERLGQKVFRMSCLQHAQGPEEAHGVCEIADACLERGSAIKQEVAEALSGEETVSLREIVRELDKQKLLHEKRLGNLLEFARKEMSMRNLTWQQVQSTRFSLEVREIQEELATISKRLEEMLDADLTFGEDEQTGCPPPSDPHPAGQPEVIDEDDEGRRMDTNQNGVAYPAAGEGLGWKDDSWEDRPLSTNEKDLVKRMATVIANQPSDAAPPSVRATGNAPQEGPRSLKEILDSMQSLRPRTDSEEADQLDDEQTTETADVDPSDEEFRDRILADRLDLAEDFGSDQDGDDGTDEFSLDGQRMDAVIFRPSGEVESGTIGADWRDSVEFIPTASAYSRRAQIDVDFVQGGAQGGQGENRSDFDQGVSSPAANESQGGGLTWQEAVASQFPGAKASEIKALDINETHFVPMIDTSTEEGEVPRKEGFSSHAQEFKAGPRPPLRFNEGSTVDYVVIPRPTYYPKLDVLVNPAYADQKNGSGIVHSLGDETSQYEKLWSWKGVKLQRERKMMESARAASAAEGREAQDVLWGEQKSSNFKERLVGQAMQSPERRLKKIVADEGATIIDMDFEKD